VIGNMSPTLSLENALAIAGVTELALVTPEGLGGGKTMGLATKPMASPMTSTTINPTAVIALFKFSSQKGPVTFALKALQLSALLNNYCNGFSNFYLLSQRCESIGQESYDMLQYLATAVFSMTKIPDPSDTIVTENAERRKLTEPTIAARRIDIRLVEGPHFEASTHGFSFEIDEPPERGGQNRALPPLAYFLAGAALCLMTQYMKLAQEKNILTMKTVARGHFDRRIGGAFTDIYYDIRIESPSDVGTIRAIAVEAETMCYAHNTLKKTVAMKTHLTLNNAPVT